MRIAASVDSICSKPRNNSNGASAAPRTAIITKVTVTISFFLDNLIGDLITVGSKQMPDIR
jgi:hypothetical protein